MTSPTPDELREAEFSKWLREKISGDELTRLYVESVAKKVASDVVDSRLKPFYRHPTVTNIITLVVGVLALIGISSFWGNAIREPIQNFLRIDRSVEQAVQKRQYEVFMGGFQLGSTASLVTEESDVCNELQSAFFRSDDIEIPIASMQSFVPSCMRLSKDFTRSDDLSFIAEANEKMYVEILLIARKTPSIDSGIEGKTFSLKRLLGALAKGGDILGRGTDSLIVARIDKDVIKLNARDSMVSVRDSSSNEIHDYQSFWAWYTIPENTGQFHNLSISLPKEADKDKYPNNLIVRVFLERNKITARPETARGD